MDLPPAPTPPGNSNSSGGGAASLNAERTANLLNLLKFSGSGSSAQHQSPPTQASQVQPFPPQQQQYQQRQEGDDEEGGRADERQAPQQYNGQSQFGQTQYSQQENQPYLQQLQQQVNLPLSQFPTRIHQPAPAGADPSGLLAALMRGTQEADESKPTAKQPAQPPQPPVQMSQPFSGGSPSADTTSYLLNLLNRPKPSQTERPRLVAGRSENLTPQSPEPDADQNRHFGQYQQPQPQSQQPHPPNPYVGSQEYQHHDSYSGKRHVSVPEPHTFPAAQDTEGDVNAMYQQLIGNLVKSSPQHQAAQSSPARGSFSIPKDKPSPASSLQQEARRPGSGRSPLNSPLEHSLPLRQADRASSLQSHHSSHRSTKKTPSVSEHENQETVIRYKETVADAVSDIADQADRDARMALARAENMQAHGEDTSNQDILAAARVVEDQIHDLEDALKDDPDYDSVDQTMIKDMQHSLRNIVDDAQVADSWESADQDEIVVIEEKEPPPIRVYNFPMKPWISISMQDESNETRPEFREESIMDIARLKKDFDQMDRNLYTASQTYMTYGMSKQGGLRVIRQDDGKDAKVFTDTKDRIFNLGMSVTPSDYDGIHREAIIGTGVSGTVYWVLVKDGEKDHVDDAHLEQYGFALPPMSSHDGDAPGGVLKTRARPSTSHPEYFAVGRGKSINFIWPAYIMQNKLFKPGHDRVVDTESLLKKSSLKINTGKAGKDFTFSQDDTVVVSLDKAGRVKFWDVRDLTAQSETSDARAPMPAQSSLEVKEPLMTLASTPEGEKPWPTSVLLLDKQRPYQKQCALRYMIVGMKQNHTLQLWDLALGKPVQEFNLPHSKESDAVCSVMYHPATGMIIIGHPTRNSVYFAHLSAPKYNLKSVSQADYIQRLVTQDTTIPQPDSTAVISGVREYSFDNRGILRSLDILSNPAMVQDTDEPTLFELYAMHSKGVACLLIKQGELGWSRDNKVLDAVDAVSEGIVTVSKLKTPQPVETGAQAESVQSRLSGRALPKDELQAASSSAEATQRAVDEVTPVKPPKNEAKELETPVQSSKENQGDRSERKSRKKKPAATNASDSVQNGTSNASNHSASNKQDGAKGLNTAVAAGFSSELLESTIAGMESRINSSVAESLRSSLQNLQTKLDEGVRVRDDSFNKHQLKLLDMVSEVLNENTQKVLESLIHQQFTDLVIPAIGDRAGKAVAELVNDRLGPDISASVSKEMQTFVPHALSRSIRSNEFINAIADRVSSTVAPRMQHEILTALTQHMSGTFANMANQSAQRLAGDLHQQYQEQIERLKSQHLADSTKIDQLLSYVTRLTDMVSTMAASQSTLQAEFLKFKQQPVHELPAVPGVQAPQSTAGSHHGAGSVNYSHATAPSHHGSFHTAQGPVQNPSFMGSPQYPRGQQHMSPQGSVARTSEQVGPSAGSSAAFAGAFANQMSQSEAEMEHDLFQRIRLIEQAIADERYQEAMIQWIQSGKQEEIFYRCLSHYPPSKFERLPPLMLLVVIATISKNLRPNPRVKEEVDWIEMAVRAFVDNMPSYEWEKQGYQEVMQSTTQTMQLLISRLRPLLAGMQDGYATDNYLKALERPKLEWIVRTSEQVLESFGTSRHFE